MTTTIVTQTVRGRGPDGAIELVGTWHKDFHLLYGAGNFSARTVQGGQRQLWCCADAAGVRFGQTYETLQQALDAIVGYDQQDVEDTTWNWYCGAEWRSGELLGHPDAEDGFESALLTNEAGPGTAKEAAYKIYAALCKDPGGCGMVWVGKIDPSAEPGEGFMEQETVERDPGQEEEDRQSRYEQYLEDNHDAIVAQERYEMWRAEC